jgi:beta-glucanase (GH16 family)
MRVTMIRTTHFLTSFLLLLLLAACATAAPVATAVPRETTVSPTSTPDWERDGWTLVWQDEFDGPEINANHWTHEIGGNGWGNGENQYYTDSPDNSFIEDGMLVIQALEQNLLGKPFTSARLTTQGKVAQQYGRIEARIQIPTGKGIWPAFWMLGENFDTVGWPRSGEIDIMENIGSEPWRGSRYAARPRLLRRQRRGHFLPAARPQPLPCRISTSTPIEWEAG